MTELDQLAKDVAKQHHALQQERVAVFLSVISRTMNVVDVRHQPEIGQVSFTLSRVVEDNKGLCLGRSVSLYLLETCMPLRSRKDASIDVLVRAMAGLPSSGVKFKIDDMFWGTVDAFKAAVERGFKDRPTPEL